MDPKAEKDRKQIRALLAIASVLAIVLLVQSVQSDGTIFTRKGAQALAGAAIIAYIALATKDYGKADGASSSEDEPENDLAEAPSSEELDAGRAAFEADIAVKVGAFAGGDSLIHATIDGEPDPSSPEPALDEQTGEAKAPDEPAPDPLQGKGWLELDSEALR